MATGTDREASMATNEQLKTMADKLRIHSLRMTTAAGSGHPSTCLSAAEIMSVLFFSVHRTRTTNSSSPRGTPPRSCGPPSPRPG